MTQRETRHYMREGRHNRDAGLDVKDHTIVFHPRGFRETGLEHLTRSHKGRFPVTIVETTCPHAHQALEGNGYTRVERYPQLNVVPPYHEELF